MIPALKNELTIHNIVLSLYATLEKNIFQNTLVFHQNMTQGVGNYECNNSSLFTLTVKPADFFFQNGQNSLYNVMLTRVVNESRLLERHITISL